MSEPRSSVVILAGPNGAGKSTAAPELLHATLAIDEFVNADVIARGLSAFAPETAVPEPSTLIAWTVLAGAGAVQLRRRVNV